jgi:hypothetical protein
MTARARRILLSVGAGLLAGLAVLGAEVLTFSALWDHWPKFREFLHALALTPLIGIVLLIIPIGAFAVAAAIGIPTAILLWPSRSSLQSIGSVVPQRVSTADAVAEALAQHRRGVAVTAVCPGCGSVISVVRPVLLDGRPTGKANLRCACGACTGAVPA